MSRANEKLSTIVGDQSLFCDCPGKIFCKQQQIRDFRRSSAIQHRENIFAARIFTLEIKVESVTTRA